MCSHYDKHFTVTAKGFPHALVTLDHRWWCPRVVVVFILRLYDDDDDGDDEDDDCDDDDDAGDDIGSDDK